MMLPIECACGLNKWIIRQDLPFTGKIDTFCCITTIHVTIETIEYSV